MKTLPTLGLCGILLAATLLSATAAGSNWPGWRGPAGTGASAEGGFAVTWDATNHIRWHTALPGPGNSSPIIWGNRVFVSQWIERENKRVLLCLDRADGKILWQSGVTYTERESTQENNPYCSGTPATDGESVYVCFGSAGVFAYDFSGKEVWHRDLGQLNHMFGNAVSPLLYGSLCVVNFGPDERARLVALNKKTGEIVWEAQPPKVDPSEQPPMRGGPGGRGGFGPGGMIAQQAVSQADKNEDQKISRQEWSDLAEAWFGKLDAEKSGKVTEAQFLEHLSELLPAPAGGGPGAGPGRGGRGFNPSRMIGPGLLAAVDSDKDGSVTHAEWSKSFGQWFTNWDTNKSGLLNEEAVREGFNAILPRSNFGGPGGPGGGRSPGGGRGGMGPGAGASWSTPILVQLADHDELVVNFPNRLTAYDPKSGQQLWLSKGIGGTIYTTPIWGEGALIAMSSGMGGGNAIAVTPGGAGDVTESKRLWRLERIKSGMGSGVIHHGHLYTISQDGIASCFHLQKGETVWEERLKGSGARSSSWSSMLLTEGRIYVPNQAGDVFVLRAAPKFEVLATNSLGEPTNASLAASDQELFLRTERSLWCIGEAKR